MEKSLLPRMLLHTVATGVMLYGYMSLSRLGMFDQWIKLQYGGYFLVVRVVQIVTPENRRTQSILDNKWVRQHKPTVLGWITDAFQPFCCNFSDDQRVHCRPRRCHTIKCYIPSEFPDTKKYD